MRGAPAACPWGIRSCRAGTFVPVTVCLLRAFLIPRWGDMDGPRKLQNDFASVELYWLPLGAGDASHCVRWNGRIFEAIAARRQHRHARDLYHSPLRVE